MQGHSYRGTLRCESQLLPPHAAFRRALEHVSGLAACWHVRGDRACPMATRCMGLSGTVKHCDVCSKKIEWTLRCHSSLRAYSAGILTSQRGPHVLPIMWRRLRGAAFIIASVTRRKHTISSLSTVKWTSLLSLATRPLDAGSLFVLAQSRREDASLDGRGQQVGFWFTFEACSLLASNEFTR